MQKENPKEVLEMIIEEKSDVSIDQFISTLPKGRQKNVASEMIVKLQEELSSNLLEQKLTEVKLKKLNEKLRVTEPMKAMKQMKTDIKKLKKDTEKLALILLGCRKMAKVMGLELPNVKAILED